MKLNRSVVRTEPGLNYYELELGLSVRKSLLEWIKINLSLFSPSVEQFRIRVPSEVPFFLLEYLRFHFAPIQRGGSKLFKFIICLSDRICEADPISGIISRHSISLSSLLKLNLYQFCN